jgi:hypothetical protein
VLVVGADWVLRLFGAVLDGMDGMVVGTTGGSPRRKERVKYTSPVGTAAGPHGALRPGRRLVWIVLCTWVSLDVGPAVRCSATRRLGSVTCRYRRSCVPCDRGTGGLLRKVAHAPRGYMASQTRLASYRLHLAFLILYLVVNMSLISRFKKKGGKAVASLRQPFTRPSSSSPLPVASSSASQAEGGSEPGMQSRSPPLSPALKQCIDLRTRVPDATHIDPPVQLSSTPCKLKVFIDGRAI